MIVLLATVVVVCGGIVVVAVGRGGQIAEFSQDAPPLELPARRPIAGTDVALLRLPTGPWGYSYRATDDALRRIAHAITERDTRIAVLEQQVSELRSALPAAGSAGDESGSPWFDRSASFEGRGRPISGRTGERAALGAVSADAPEEPVGTEPEDAAPRDDVPGDAGPRDGLPSGGLPGDDPAGDDLPGDAAAGVDAPEGVEPDAYAGPAWVEQKAWTPGAAWFDNGASPKPAEPVDDEPEPETAEADEAWAFEDDAEPAAEPAGKPTASAFGTSTPAPWPGDRLVASSRPRTEPEDRAEEKAGAAATDGMDETEGEPATAGKKAGVVGEDGVDEAGGEADAETGGVEDGDTAGRDGEGMAGGKVDGVEGDAMDGPGDGTADGGSRGEGH